VVGIQKRNALFDRVKGLAAAAGEPALDNIPSRLLGNAFLEAIFIGQAAGADEKVEQDFFHIFSLTSKD
jgi:hypothetical protein